MLATCLVLSLSGLAEANERHFTYVYESATLPTSGREIEIWTTPRIGREDYYWRFDQRAEFEVGITDRLQTALYLNFEAISEETGDVMASEFAFGGVSSEWKYRFLDDVTDGLGLAAYIEGTGATHEWELEGKLILDKHFGDLLVAGNLVAEQEWERDMGETEGETGLDAIVGAAWAFTPGIHAGLEIQSHNTIKDGEYEHSALFAGPCFSYATDGWWLALTILPQLPALHKEDSGGDSRVLDDHEKLNARLLFAFHL